jgi:hypothetical protein
MTTTGQLVRDQGFRAEMGESLSMARRAKPQQSGAPAMVSTSSKTACVAAIIVAVATPATAAVPEQCNNRIVHAQDKWEPLAPGCRRMSCSPMYRVVRDDKGTYCIQHFGCGIYCKPKPPGQQPPQPAPPPS